MFCVFKCMHAWAELTTFSPHLLTLLPTSEGEFASVLIICACMQYVCVNNGNNLFSTPYFTLYCQHQKVNFVVHTHRCMCTSRFNLAISFLLATLPTSAGEIYKILCILKCMNTWVELTIFSPHLLILLQTSGGNFTALFCFLHLCMCKWW